jgi:outer membrane protein OmpA-like peptidoglycan-associated protein
VTSQPENVSSDRESTEREREVLTDLTLDRLISLLIENQEEAESSIPLTDGDSRSSNLLDGKFQIEENSQIKSQSFVVDDRPKSNSVASHGKNGDRPEKLSESSLDSEFLELNIDFVPQANKLTFNEAVAYEAFLPQQESGVSRENYHLLTNSGISFCQIVGENKTSNSKTDAVQLNNTLDLVKTDGDRDDRFLSPVSSASETPEEQLAAIQANLNDDNIKVEDLADTVNALIPLIVELLNYKVGDTRESILQAIIPVIDRIIEQRTVEDAPKMAAALAPILPHAIAEKIQISPQAIARAIAPEIALAIEEQIRLDRDAISRALGSEMGRAIKTQIELEKDAMVDALYPVIGSTISKYMVEVVQEINYKIEHTLSREGFRRKIRAKLQGVSEAELILQEAVNYRVQAVFLIDKDSGLIIQEVQPDSQHRLQSDLVAGMLTAIRSFANDCIVSGSELDTIDYGDWQIPIEVAGYCYLAVVVKGEPTKKFRAKIRQVLGTIVLQHGHEIENYQGDPATVSEKIQNLLSELVEPENSKIPKKSSPTALIWLLAMLCGMILIPWGIVSYRAYLGDRLEGETTIRLDAAPELSVYRIEPKISEGKLTLTGRVSDDYLRSRATAVVRPIADSANLQVDNQILVVDVPILNSSRGEIQRLTTTFNRQPDIAISTEYEKRTLTIAGFILNPQELPPIVEAFQTIPGVKTVIVATENKLPSFEERIYFKHNSAELNPAKQADLQKINNIEQFLARHPQLNLRLIAHSDRGEKSIYQGKLARQRLDNIKNSLITRGVDRDRLKLEVSDRNPPNLKDDSSEWLSRCVRFESFIPTN